MRNKIQKLQTGSSVPYRNLLPYQQPISFLNQSLTSDLVNSGDKGNKNMLPNFMEALKPKPLQLAAPKLDTKTLGTNKAIGSTGKKLGFFGGMDTADKLDLGSAAIDTIGSLAPQLDHVSGASNAINGASAVAGMIPGPWGQGIKMGLKAITAVDQLTGKSANSQQTAGQTATGYGLDFNANASTSYGGLFGNKARKNTNLLTARQDYSNSFKLQSSFDSAKNTLASSNSMQDVYAKNSNQRQGGLTTRMLAASKGMKLSLSKIVQKVNAKIEPEQESKMNVIPSGALHSRKHNLPDEIGDQVTNKGIPVVSFEAEGKITQHCEVEREELTLHKQLTVKLEDLLDQYNNANEEDKDKLLIKTGKLLTYEILENTQDNTDLINKTE